jgi:hypothetical protein
MKRFLVTLLAVGLILAIGMPAAAQVKFSGQYTYEGWLENNHTLKDNTGSSTGWQDHTLLLNAAFKPAEGISLYTRARILDKIWGDGASGAGSDVRDRMNNTGRYMRENIEFDYLYLQAKVGPGSIQIGSAPSMLGTTFLDTDNPTNQIAYFLLTRSYYLGLCYEKFVEREVVNPAARTFGTGADVDRDRFKLTGILFRPKWNSGFTAYYLRDAGNRPLGVTTKVWVLDPYFRGTFGPLYVEAEGVIVYGKNQEFEAPVPLEDVDREGYSFYAKARYTFGPAYVGGSFIWVSGDKPDTRKNETGGATGREFKPALILANPDRDKWLGALGTGGNATPLADAYTGDGVGYAGGVANIMMWQVFAGFKPLPKLELVATYSNAKLDQNPGTGAASYVSKDLGQEADITATYKIYDNLSYMVGAGYLWTGDAWKGNVATNTVSNDWLLMHKLTLTF